MHSKKNEWQKIPVNGQNLPVNGVNIYPATSAVLDARGLLAGADGEILASINLNSFWSVFFNLCEVVARHFGFDDRRRRFELTVFQYRETDFAP